MSYFNLFTCIFVFALCDTQRLNLYTEKIYIFSYMPNRSAPYPTVPPVRCPYSDKQEVSKKPKNIS